MDIHTHYDLAIDWPGLTDHCLRQGITTVVGGNCGIGFTIRAFDGQVWTYCHLSYRDPAVVKGASLSAGQQVGLVGSTGHATGPHLHLQLQPATSWPQRQSWFLSFAGTAFTWSDEGAPLEPAAARTLAFAPAAAAGPVFEVVEDASKPRIVRFTRTGP